VIPLDPAFLGPVPPIVARWISIAAGALIACSDPPAPAPLDAEAQDAPDAGFAPIGCGEPRPGPPLDPGAIEAQPGYAAELAALDLTQVPDPFDLGAEDGIRGALINYLLGRAGGTSVTAADLAAAGALGTAVAGAIVKSSSGAVDFAFLRRGLHHFYACARPIPGTLAELAARYGDHRGWPRVEIACSRPKDRPRTIFGDGSAGAYVVETLDGDQVRETEVIFTDLRSDGQLDFAAYTAGGELSDRSTFATGGGGERTTAVPFTCITCHGDPSTNTITRLLPTGTGAGCR
jgi:hypothetical protein